MIFADIEIFEAILKFFLRKIKGVMVKGLTHGVNQVIIFVGL